MASANRETQCLGYRARYLGSRGVMFLRMVVGIVLGVEVALTSIAWGQESTKTFHQGPVQGERFRFRDEANGVRILEICPHTMSKARKRLLVFATPNGNTAEQSLGCIAAEGIDWHFDIQHIGAQYRWLRDRSEDCDWILVIVQSSQLSWPAFRQSNPQADGQIRKIVESLQQEWQAAETYLSCHSGGGSFLWGWMNAYETLPSTVQRLIFLDANYSYSDELHHGDKLLQWLKNDAKNRLFVLAYDDREITLDGKKVVGETGGTYRATERMVKRFGLEEKGEEGTWLDFRTRSFFEERIQCLVHRNLQNAILHTRLVGEMNGLIAACCWEEGMTIQSLLNGPRCYSEKVQRFPYAIPENPMRDNLLLSRECPWIFRPDRTMHLPVPSLRNGWRVWSAKNVIKPSLQRFDAAMYPIGLDGSCRSNGTSRQRTESHPPLKHGSCPTYSPLARTTMHFGFRCRRDWPANWGMRWDVLYSPRECRITCLPRRKSNWLLNR